MPAETRTCQNCNTEFGLGTEDLALLARLKVPRPTFCHECRWQRQLSFRNARNLYHRKDSKIGRQIISIYSPDKDLQVYEQHLWAGDSWDPMDHGREYDFSRPFFEQMRELMRAVPLPSMNNWDAVNSDYCNFTKGNKNCYMIFGGDFNEDTSYSTYNFYTKNSADLHWVNKSEFCYELVDSEGCYRSAFGNFLESCLDIRFGYELTGCQNCIGCTNLRNQKYRIWNEQLTPEEYKRRVAEMDFGSYRFTEEMRKKFEEVYSRSIFRAHHIFNSTNSTGDNIHNGKDCAYCFDIFDGAENCRYVLLAGSGLKDSYGSGHCGLKSELLYDSLSVYPSSRIIGSWIMLDCQDAHHSVNCRNCSHVFGCVGLKGKSYCIFNRQYSKEEYEELVPKIIAQMKEMPYIDAKGRKYGYGEFFPPELSFFGYNETMAFEYWPLTKEAALKKGFEWYEAGMKDHKITMATADIPDHIRDAGDDIIQEVIACAHEGRCNHGCTTAFKIIPQELVFYRQMNLPLPRLCLNCRHVRRMGSRNPPRLWRRSCECRGKDSHDGIYENTVEHFHGANACPNEFETSYAPERPEVVYCEQCYQHEVV